jgi:hypothetical protein
MSLRKFNVMRNNSMSTRSFRPALLLLLIPAAMGCSLFTSAPIPSQADIDQEEQAVYGFFAMDKETPLILQETSTGVSDDDARTTIENLKGNLPGISKATIDSYIARNTLPAQLSPDMNLGMDYILLSQDDLAKITRQPNWNEILAEKYPGSNGYLIFSHAGFNRTLDQAVIYVGQVAGPLMGSGSYYLLEKQNGEWKIKKEIGVWIS